MRGTARAFAAGSHAAEVPLIGVDPRPSLRFRVPGEGQMAKGSGGPRKLPTDFRKRCRVPDFGKGFS